MATECCKELKGLLEKYDDEKTEIDEQDFFIFANTVNEYSRQCKCLLRNPNLILPLENLLKKFYTFALNYTEILTAVEEWNHELLATSERLYQAVCKSFQLQYPLYQAYESVKNNFEVTEEQKVAIGKFCDTLENANASELLFENIADFCEKGGTEKINNCYKDAKSPLPLSLASNLISIIGQIRAWMHDDAIVRLLKPMSGPVTKYLCNIHEDELRQMSARQAAESMLNTVKVQDNEQISYDSDVLEIAYKYFMSTTLAVRMAGLNLITNQIHNMIEMGQNQVFGDLDSLCTELAVWLNDKEMVEHLFGPNYHVELIKQSQFLLNFLAQERQLKSNHLDSIWAAAQLKHISRYVMDILITLAKTMDLLSVQYLLKQIASMSIMNYSKQTLLLSSLLTRNIWTAGLSGCCPEERPVQKVSPKKMPFQPKSSLYKQLHVSPIQSPSLSSDASSDDEIADIHARRLSDNQLEQMQQLRSLDLKMNDTQMRALTNAPLLHLSQSPIESCLLGSQGSAIIAEAEDTISCTNTNGSSGSDREQDVDDLDEESSLTSIVTTPIKQRASEPLPIEFDVDTLCEPGKTLLWDLIQDQSLETLNDGIQDEAQRLLWQLICYSGNKKVRMVFIKGCLDNIQNNRAIIVSFKILPKILSVYPHASNSADSAKILTWAIKELDLMKYFFENLKEFTKLWPTEKENDELVSDREQQIQSRLDFLSAMYSNEITPDHFRLTTAQVDCLWQCLVSEIPDVYHYLILSWLLKQTNSDELHALGLDSFKHIFVNKLTELNAEKMTLTGLSLFQKLFGLTRLSNASPFAQQEDETEEYLLGTEQLWNIALKAERLHVANETMNILNHLYLAVGEGSVRKEKEFIQKCMSVLQEAVKNLEQNCLQALKSIQQVLKILWNHLDTYNKRFAFHLEVWKLSGYIKSHQRVVKGNNKEHVLRIICQPTGVTEKVTFKMLSSDLLAKFRARVTHWCVRSQQEKDEMNTNNDNATVLKPPFRLISHGHELTPDLDMKSLWELGVRDQQLVYISVANIRKERLANQSQLPPSLQSQPNFESVPMIQLVKEENFRQLFSLLDVLYKVVKSEDYQALWCAVVENKIEESSFNENGGENAFDDPHELVKPLSAENLLYKAWELILMLPTDPTTRNKLMKLEFDKSTNWSLLLNLDKKFKLLYILQILDSLSLPLIKNNHSEMNTESSGDSDSSLSDVDKDTGPQDNFSLSWIKRLFENGFVKHLLDLVLSINMRDGDQDEWSLNCVAYIIKILTRIGLVNLASDEKPPSSPGSSGSGGSSSSVTESKPVQPSSVAKRWIFRAKYRSTEADNAVVIHCFNQLLLDLLDEETLCSRMISILCFVSETTGETSNMGTQDVRASVVYHCLSFLVCWVSSNDRLRETLIGHETFGSVLIQMVFFSPQKSVRAEASHGIYKLCLSGGPNVLNKVLNLLLGKLSELVSLRHELKLQGTEKPRSSQSNDDKSNRSSSSNYKDYFWLLCRLIQKFEHNSTEEVINIRTIVLQVSMFIQDEECNVPLRTDNTNPTNVPIDYCLIGLLQTMASLLHHDTEFKSSPQGYQLMENIFYKCLFHLPDAANDGSYVAIRPRCDTKFARQAAYDLLLQLVTNCKDTYLELQKLFLRHHSSNPKTNTHCSYGWNYWPYEQEKSSVGFVGLINLGATCYMASCVQQLFMIPEARTTILQSPLTKNSTYSGILKEVQRMFAYLQGSIRKAYNPKTLCKTYIMDKQPLNTGEQKDMTEFFTDFVSKLEEMGPNLKQMMRELFCGVITNNVISLDCTHVSKTEEEFYSVRCTVADMKNLYESLDEVTVKDVLEGDNKYTCSQCNAKVRAEKRACFKSLPKVMCFNTMRYTFNMVTMMKEKVNTHFSFPMKLNMAAYTEEYLLADKEVGDHDDIPGHWYNLAGVVVHTGTAEGGHYYSFIRDRTSKENNWYLFNDAEVKTFDPMQIAAECFGGETTTKTFDAMTEKYMDFSFEKTHSAYMLFYEHCDMDKEPRQTQKVSLPKDLRDLIWEDNYQFLQDKLVFEPAYFNFIWQFCSAVPKSIGTEVTFNSTKLATSFLLETLVHSREKPHMKGWVELLMYGFEHCPKVCEWFLNHMSDDDWWLQQLFIKCPAQHIRQMFGQLCLIAIRSIRPMLVHLYNKEEEEDGEENPCAIKRFIKSILTLLEDPLRSYCKNLGELFHFLYQFLSLGHEECAFMLKMDVISLLVQFYNNLKSTDGNDERCDEDDDIDLDEDEILSMFPDEKFYPGALEKMIGSIALLLEEARDGPELHLSDSDMQCFVNVKESPFIYQITADAVNLRQTAHIIFHLSRYNEPFAEMIVALLLSAAQKLPLEQSQPFFKLLSFLTDVGENGLPGLPSFTAMILPKIWQAAEVNPALTLDWLSNQVPRNKQAHQFVLQNMDKWVEKYLISDSNPRIRGGAAYLLVSLVPHHHFPQAFRGRMFSAPQKDTKQMTSEAKSILHQIYIFLLTLLPNLKQYCDKTHSGTTRLVNYFTVLNYCCISDEEKAMFTPFSNELWKLYHPTMSEPDIAVHFNKQALLTFWYHVCDGYEGNVKFITDTEDVTSNIAYNYILSNDDQEVISYNNSTLPVYYGLLRLACCASPQFRKNLSTHPNMTWAFEHLMPRANHYPQAVEELLQLIRLFATYSEPVRREDLEFAVKFKGKAIELFCSCMDGQHSWTTLVSILKILIESEEDCIHVACNNGLNPLGEAFSTLHLMYHEATACNVTSDILEVSNLTHTILECCHNHMQKIPAAAKALNSWMERTDIMLKALSLLNSFVSRDIHKAMLELLTILLQAYPDECIETVAPVIHQSHMSIRMTQTPAPVGPYFPKQGSSKMNSRKIAARSNGPELNMTLHPLLVDSAKGQDKNYELQLAEYFEGYHIFVDKMCRYGLNLDQVPTIIIEISCMLAVEVLPLNFHLFPKLWQEVWSKSSENSKYRNCLQRLYQCESFIEFMDTLFQDERELFDNPVFYSFVCYFLPKVHTKVLADQKQNVVNMIITSLVADVSSSKLMTTEEFKEISVRVHGDIRALCLLLSVTQAGDVTVSQLLESYITAIVTRIENESNESKASTSTTAGDTENNNPDNNTTTTPTTPTPMSPTSKEISEPPHKKRKNSDSINTTTATSSSNHESSRNSEMPDVEIKTDDKIIESGSATPSTPLQSTTPTIDENTTPDTIMTPDAEELIVVEETVINTTKLLPETTSLEVSTCDDGGDSSKISPNSTSVRLPSSGVDASGSSIEQIIDIPTSGEDSLQSSLDLSSSIKDCVTSSKDSCDVIRASCNSPQPGPSREKMSEMSKDNSNSDVIGSGSPPIKRRNSNSSCSSSHNLSDNEDSSNASSEESSSSESEKQKRNTVSGSGASGKKIVRKPNATNALRKACESLLGLLKRRREKEAAINNSKNATPSSSTSS